MNEQRHTASHPCPICAGFDSARRGQGVRCGGKTVESARALCTREEFAHGLPLKEGGVYVHFLTGPCHGVRHDGPTAPPTLPARPKGARTAEVRQGRTVAVYDYPALGGGDARDGAYRVLRQVDGSGNKSFTQQWLDAAQGRWRPGRNGFRPRLFHLDALRAAPAATPVHVLEGEKDVLRAEADGFLATTNPGGAAQWRAAYAAELAGRDVRVFVDNDTDGMRWALQVATSLHGIARSVRLLRLPGLPEHGDYSDWRDAGGTLDELEALIAQTPAWAPPDTPDEEEGAPFDELARFAGYALPDDGDVRNEIIRVQRRMLALRDAQLAAIQESTRPAQQVSAAVTVIQEAAALHRWQAAPLPRAAVADYQNAKGEHKAGLATKCRTHPKNLGKWLKELAAAGIVTYTTAPVAKRRTGAYLALPDFDATAPNRGEAIYRAQLAALDRLRGARQTEEIARPARGEGSRPRVPDRFCPTHPTLPVTRRTTTDTAWRCPHLEHEEGEVIDAVRTVEETTVRPPKAAVVPPPTAAQRTGKYLITRVPRCVPSPSAVEGNRGIRNYPVARMAGWKPCAAPDCPRLLPAGSASAICWVCRDGEPTGPVYARGATSSGGGT